MPAKPTATLRGHKAAILFIGINDPRNYLISFSKDRVSDLRDCAIRCKGQLSLLHVQELRVWDMQDQVCLQSSHRFDKLGAQVPEALYIHPQNALLLLATNELGVLEPSEGGDFFVSHEVHSHSQPLCAALYSEHFSQVSV